MIYSQTLFRHLPGAVMAVPNRPTNSIAAPASGAGADKPKASGRKPGASKRMPTELQLAWLRRGLIQPGGKLPLFDESGQRVSGGVVTVCQRAGWAEPWFQNPLKPDWEVCRLTEAGRVMLAEVSVVTVDFRKSRS